MFPTAGENLLFPPSPVGFCLASATCQGCAFYGNGNVTFWGSERERERDCAVFMATRKQLEKRRQLTNVLLLASGWLLKNKQHLWKSSSNTWNQVISLPCSLSREFCCCGTTVAVIVIWTISMSEAISKADLFPFRSPFRFFFLLKKIVIQRDLQNHCFKAKEVHVKNWVSLFCLFFYVLYSFLNSYLQILFEVLDFRRGLKSKAGF